MSSPTGQKMIDFAKKLYPICRSITGDGVRQTLKYIQEEVPQLNIHEMPSGTSVFDWTVPKEWNINEAYIIDPDGQKIMDFKKNNLHLVSYSVPVNLEITLDTLQQHLYSIPENPEAIPYITSYYQERWGFCLADQQRKQLKPGKYRVVIDSELKAGSLTYADVILPGKEEKELFFSTYICHPSMANNELSGPTVSTFLLKWLPSLKQRRYSYRFVFVPETIGSIVYLSQHLDAMKKNIQAGFNLTCIGDDRAYSYLPSRKGNTLADRVAQHVLKHTDPQYRTYSFLERGSDERQYCSPGVDLPVVNIMRTKYGCYPEYHTSLDNFDVVTATGLAGGYEVAKKCIQTLETNAILMSTVLCEPQFGKRGLYPTLSTIDSSAAQAAATAANYKNLMAYCDGELDLLSIAERINVPAWQVAEMAETLMHHGLLKTIG